MNIGDNGKGHCECWWYETYLIWISVHTEPAWSYSPSTFTCSTWNESMQTSAGDNIKHHSSHVTRR